GGHADLYLEGSDQHRGWFHSALLTGVAVASRAPYDLVITHGFFVDGSGRKMSKSLGNVIAPEEILKRHGAELLRLWVAATDYREEMRISEEILGGFVEAYRRVRNTARFLLANLYDFDPARDAVPVERLPELERWALHQTHALAERCLAGYEDFEFHLVFHALNDFCSVDLSAFYLDVRKDRLYCERAQGPERRATQTVLHAILDVLVRLMAPVLSFTAEDVWRCMPGAGRPDSVLLAGLAPPPVAWRAPDVAARAGREVSALLEHPRPRPGLAPSRPLRALRRRGRVSPLADHRLRLAGLVAAAVLAADQASKGVVGRAMVLHETVDLLPFFALTHVRNTGAAFGALAAAPPAVRLPLFFVVTLAAVRALVSLVRRTPADQRGLVGALGGVL